MLTHCSEEKPGSRIEIYSIKIFAALLIFSIESFSQVPINGFCKYNRFDTDSGYTNLFALNYNDDSYTDLILYNPSQKNIEALDGNQSISFSSPHKYKLQSEISLIKNVVDKNNIVTGYICCSRKRMNAGLVSFAKNGKPVLTNEIKLKSYPENISVADINGKSEIGYLISGKSFDGLSILTTQNKKLKETQIASNSAYSYSQFVDLSRDGFPDIVAFNLASLNLDLFHNIGNGKFNKVRSIPVTENINTLRTFDLDLDSFEDIIIAKQNSIEILYASFNSSFDFVKNIKTKYNPDKIIIGDFNKDGRMDIAYLDTSLGILSVLFGKDNRDFYPEVIYFRKQGSMDLIPFYSKFINGIAVINEHGSLYLISSFTSVAEEFSIALGSEQQGLNYFDHNKDGIPDICFIDNTENNLNLILRNISGIPSLYYSIPLIGNESKIYPDYLEKNKVTFYCYSKGKKLIESVKVDFIKSSFAKNSFYVPKNIVDIGTEHKDPAEVKLFVVQLENEKLSMTVFNSISVNYLNSYYTIADNVINVSKGNKNSAGFYFWQSSGDSLILYKASFNNNLEKPYIKYSVKIKKDYSIVSLKGDYFSNKNACFNLIHAPGLYQTITLSDNNVYTFNKKEVIEELKDADQNSFYVNASNFRGTDRIFFYSDTDSKLRKIELLNKGENIIISPVCDIQNAGDYFIKNMDMRNFNLVYSNKKENCITVKQIQ
ncbi:MAG: VCBS repeat-containing protein [Ignavibacteriaceae bacterium]|nr:VCBS repeat-containing protein [Ignavibacteriaceae bacterium]